uniref:Uncharacterized protein n=1 Tax=Ditylenchus dipsaci TaxID=166011 RepID=A0A915DYR7_9BILA
MLPRFDVPFAIKLASDSSSLEKSTVEISQVKPVSLFIPVIFLVILAFPSLSLIWAHPVILVIFVHPTSSPTISESRYEQILKELALSSAYIFHDSPLYTADASLVVSSSSCRQVFRMVSSTASGHVFSPAPVDGGISGCPRLLRGSPVLSGLQLLQSCYDDDSSDEEEALPESPVSTGTNKEKLSWYDIFWVNSNVVVPVFSLMLMQSAKNVK